MPKPTPESTSKPTPSTAMVFAAGLGQRMRPITDAIPKPLIKVGGRTLIDHCLDRLAEAGVGKAIVNVHWLADQIEAQLETRVAPQIVISDERAKLLDQGGGIKKALPLIGDAPFFICNTDALWIEGPRSELDRLIKFFDPAADGRAAARRPGGRRRRRRLAGRLHHGSLQPIDEARPALRRAVRLRRLRRHQAAAVRRNTPRTCSVWRRSSSAPPSRAGSTACASTESGCTSAGRNRYAEAERAIDRSRL